jgi:hypothetical protein
MTSETMANLHQFARSYNSEDRHQIINEFRYLYLYENHFNRCRELQGSLLSVHLLTQAEYTAQFYQVNRYVPRYFERFVYKGRFVSCELCVYTDEIMYLRVSFTHVTSLKHIFYSVNV